MNGTIYLEVKGLNLDKFINEVTNSNVPLLEIFKVSPKVIRIKTTLSGYEIIKKHKVSKFFSVKVKKVWGFRQKLTQTLKYSGVMAGIILSFLLFYLSTRYVTNVEIIKETEHVCGNGSKCIFEECNQSELLSYLEAIGVSNGETMNSIIPIDVERKVVAKFESVTSCSIKKSGTIVRVELHEGQVENSGNDLGLDIIAPENAKILSMTVSMGEPQVKAGDVVTKGTVLVKGVNGKKAMATVNMKIYLQKSTLYFENQIELEDTGVCIENRYFSVLGKELFKKNVENEQGYRIEYKSEDLTRGLFIPIKLVTVTMYEQKPVEKCVKIQEKRDELESNLQRDVDKLAEKYNGNISYKFIETDMGGGCYLLDCYAELDYIMNIK